MTADSGFFSGRALHAMKERGIDVYVPDNNLRHDMQTGQRAQALVGVQSATPSIRNYERNCDRRKGDWFINGDRRG